MNYKVGDKLKYNKYFDHNIEYEIININKIFVHIKWISPKYKSLEKSTILLEDLKYYDLIPCKSKFEQWLEK